MDNRLRRDSTARVAAAFLVDQGPLALVEIATLTGVGLGSMHKVIKVLAANGCIEKVPSTYGPVVKGRPRVPYKPTSVMRSLLTQLPEWQDAVVLRELAATLGVTDGEAIKIAVGFMRREIGFNAEGNVSSVC